MKLSSILAVGAAIGSTLAFWRMECRGRSGIARIDPLMSPNEIAQHVHVIHGSSGFSETASYQDLISGDCTSCAVTQDKSAYWSPAAYFKHDNGTMELVPQVGGMLAYYQLNLDSHRPGEGIKAFPEGFRMIAGDSRRRNYSVGGLDATQPDPEKSLWAALGQTHQSDLAQRAIGFNCLHYNKPNQTNEGTLIRHYLPPKSFLDANCYDGIRIELMFPSCWNGKDLDSTNHRDHVAYPDLVMAGTCPEGFEIKLPSLMYETIWDTHAFENVSGEFLISNGDPTGFGYHGDFMMGWNGNFLQEAVDTCLNLSGMVEDCPLFHIQDEATQNQCSFDVPAQLASEKVTGMVGTGLPGGVGIFSGPDPAPVISGTGFVGGANPAGAVATPTVAVPSASAQFAASSGSSGSSYSADGVFLPLSTPAAPVPTDLPGNAHAQQVGPTPTPAPVVASPSGPENAFSTQLITDGGVVTELIWEEDIVYVTQEVTTTQVVTLGGGDARRHLRHLRHHARHLRH